MEEFCISIEDTAKMLSISRNLAYTLARRKQLPGVIHLGGKRMVVSKLVILKWLEKGEQLPNN